MPYSVNGFGTGLVAASKKRIVNDCKQFDAIEALMLAYLPIVPYRAMHVLAIWDDAKNYETEQYQSAPLRLAGRLVLKAFLNRWGNLLALFGGAMFVLAGIACATMSRPFNRNDANFLAISVGLCLLGLMLKLVWLCLSRSDERIKNILGPHELGTSDPWYWPRDVAQATTEQVLQEESAASLVDVARRALAGGDRPKAMYCVRLARHDGRNVEAQELFDRLINSR